VRKIKVSDVRLRNIMDPKSMILVVVRRAMQNLARVTLSYEDIVRKPGSRSRDGANAEHFW
jgi:hypothetical protein